MRAILLIADGSNAHTSELLGLQVGQRALFAAVDAGATRIELERWSDAAVQPWSQDERMQTPLEPFNGGGGEALVLAADALIAPALLAELALGEAIETAAGARVAARVQLGAGESPALALGAATPRPWRTDRYHYALRCDGASALRRAERALLASLVKSSDGPVSRYVNRPISTAISRRLVAIGVSADRMTLVSALVAAAAAACAAGSTFALHALGALLFQLHSILDGCDGEIARLTRRSTPRGALLDSLVDDASNLLFFGALAYGVAGSTRSDWPLVAGAVAVAAYIAVIALQYAVVLRATGSGDKTHFWTGPESAPGKAPALLHELLRRNVFIALILLAVLAGCAPWVVAVLPFAALGALASSVRRARFAVGLELPTQSSIANRNHA
jgi:1L-myo-inositol 1-phosphate cytidylyltransferase / CDP-L-myo-inositol myo-inositolphosphotransferase